MFSRRSVILSCAVAFLVSAPVFAQNIQSLEATASVGDPRARARLAIELLVGDLVPRDAKRAADLAKYAMENGDALGRAVAVTLEGHHDVPDAAGNYALYDLGASTGDTYCVSRREVFGNTLAPDQLETGKALSREFQADVRKAYPVPDDLDALRRTADRGSPESQYQLGKLYEVGNMVPLDPDIAKSWYRKAADQGHVLAQFRLGLTYLTFGKTPEDTESALHWLQIAAEQNNEEALLTLIELYGNFPPWKGRIPVDTEEQERWERKLSESGSTSFEMEMARQYRRGLGVPKDFAVAADWVRKAAESGDPQARAVLGLLYAVGMGVKQDFAEAADWLGQAALDPDVDWERARDVLNDDGPATDPQVYAWFLLAYASSTEQAEDFCSFLRDDVTSEDFANDRIPYPDGDTPTNRAELYEALSGAYEDGYLSDPDGAHANAWMRKAAEAGNADAQTDPDTAYEDEEGSTQDSN